MQMKKIRILAGMLSFIWMLGWGLPVSATQTEKAFITVSENRIENTQTIVETEKIAEAEGIAEAELTTETETITETEIAVKEEVIREKLQEKLSKKDIYAVVYKTDFYEVKGAADGNSETTAILASADTVGILDVSLEWVEEDGECIPKIWFFTQFYVGEELLEGYIQEEYLVSSDELLKEWKQEFYEIFEIDEIISFETDYSDVERFPYSYRILLKELKEKHPNWTFVVMNVNRDWDACVTEQLGDYSWIYYNQPAEFLGEKINSTWNYATKAGISYYMDPRNFLTENNIFMFEQNTYNKSYHTVSALQKFLNNTFMSGIVPDKNETRTYAQVIYNSGQTRGLSPFNLAARIIQEQGVNGNSHMISGKYPGYEGYYNFYNISASGSTNAEVYKNGLTYAKNKGWDTRVKALEGGANFIGNGYILQGQDTLYLQKFDVLHEKGLHQYMQNIMAPYTEGRSMRSMYVNAGSINSDFVFKIPVFLNMPSANPLKSISFADTQEELFITEAGVTQVPVMQEDGTTDYVSIGNEADRKEIQVLFEAEDNTQDITDDTTVTWQVADESIISLTPGEEDGKAVITALKGGTTTVTAKVGKLKATMEVTVRIPMVEAKLSQTELTLFAGQKSKLGVTYAPLNNTDDTDILWWSSEDAAGTKTDNGVVRIENGSIYAIEEGTTYVHAKIGAFDGKQEELICKVTVKTYTISFKNVATDGTVKTLLNAEGIYGKTLSEIENVSSVEFPWEQVRSDYVFLGWYSEKNGKGIEITPDTVVNGNVTLYSYFEKAEGEFFIKPVGNRQYTGAKIKPKVQVYDKNGKLLTEDKDYTVSYKNNFKVSSGNTGDKPVITVSGIGNYGQIKEITFDILPRDISESTVEVGELFFSYNGKMQKATPSVKDENRNLQKDKDYTVEFPQTEEGAYLEAGVYFVKIVGKGNYTGERITYITITKKRLVMDAQVTPIKKIAYTGKECTPDVELTYGKSKLKENKDYTLQYFDNTEVGTASVLINGIGDYAGSRLEKFQITGASMEKVSITGVKNKEYTGSEIKQNGYLVCDASGNVLTENQDYSVSYFQNVQTGTAKMIVTGMGSYEGEKIQFFEILPYKMDKEGTKVKVSEITTNYIYDKAGVKPEVVVTFDGKTLVKNQDYELVYRNNENIGKKGEENAPTVLVKGKGNFTGEIQKEFSVVQKDISVVQISAKDIAFKRKKSFCFAEPVLKEKSSGTILTKGKDYSTEYTYEYSTDATLWDGSKRSAGEVVKTEDIPMPGTIIKVIVYGAGNYKGQVSCTYKVKNAPEELQEELDDAKKEMLDTKESQELLQEYALNEGDKLYSVNAVTEESMETDRVENVAENLDEKREQYANVSNKNTIVENSNQSEESLQENLKDTTKIAIEESFQPVMTEENAGQFIGESRKENTGDNTKESVSEKIEESKEIVEKNNSIWYKIMKTLDDNAKSFEIKTSNAGIFILSGCVIILFCVIIMLIRRKKEA